MDFVKSDGLDWLVLVRVPGEADLFEVSVFGVATELEARREGFLSFGVTPEEPGGHEVVSVEMESQ